MAHNYDAKSIKALKGLEGVRMRPAMYIGSVDSDGIYQIAQEIISNSADEYQAGCATEIDIIVDTNKPEFLITDNGRGIPPDKHEEGVSAITVVLTTLHAGGKFDHDSYTTSGGLHGVGASCTNACSEVFVVNVLRDNKVYHQEFHKGKPTTPDVVLIKNNLPEFKGYNSGTSIRFTPDYDIFDKKAGVDVKKLRTSLSELSCLCPGLTITLTIDDGECETFKSDAGLKDLLKVNVPKDVELLHDDIFSIQNDTYDIALCWTADTENEYNWAFVNRIFTPDGGTHLTGLKKAVSAAVVERTKKSVYNDDIRVGMYMAIHAKIRDPLFQGQVKSKLLNTEVTNEVYDFVYKELGKLLDEDTRLVDLIVDRALQLADARETMRKQKKALKNITNSLVSKNKRGVLPGKLAEAPRCQPTEREIFIVEGDSAFGTVKMARDNYYQEAFPLRGKIINASRADMAHLFKNQEILDVVTAIGAGAGDECDVKKSRVSKIFFLADADPDGQHISAMLASFFVNYMRPLVEAGMVYSIRSPLFKANYKNATYFGDSLEEVRDQLPKNANVFITRIKGHGEVGPSTLREYAMDPKTRKTYQITVDDAQIALLDQVMGADSAFRKIILGVDE